MKRNKYVLTLPNLTTTPLATPLGSAMENTSFCGTIKKATAVKIKRCPLPGKMHECSFDEDGETSLQLIAKTLCKMTSKFDVCLFYLINVTNCFNSNI